MGEKVKRFVITDHPQQHKSGEFVKYEDYEQQAEIIELLEARVATLVHDMGCLLACYDSDSELSVKDQIAFKNHLDETPQQNFAASQIRTINKIATSFLLQHVDQKRISVDRVVRWLGSQAKRLRQQQGS